MRHMSKASSITSRPRRSQNSSNSGEGGLWLVRMAFTPAAFMISQLAFGGAAVHGRAERAQVVVQADAVQSSRAAVEQRSPCVLSNAMVRMPNGVV